jgi:predicted DCC family thiol-disulfide oxidoreductase YuxK
LFERHGPIGFAAVHSYCSGIATASNTWANTESVTEGQRNRFLAAIASSACQSAPQKVRHGPAGTRRTTVASQTTAVIKPSSALGLLIFDGDCGFCTAAARKFAGFASESIQIAPWQVLDLADYGLTEIDCSTAPYWVQDGVNHRGADAFVHGLQVCKTPLPLMGKLLGLPPLIWLARAFYPVLAKYRHRLPGATDACRID